MKRVFILIAFLMIVCTPALLAIKGETEGTTIDINVYLVAAEAIFLTGVGGMSVNSLLNVLKRMLKADGIGVILLSVGVSAISVVAYLVPTGFDWIKFLIYTTLVTLAANGIYLNPQKRPRKPAL
jgi:hypothetical protein